MGILQRLRAWSTSRQLRRLEGNENFEFLRRHPLFREMKGEALVFLHEQMFERRYKRHEVIFEQGQPGVCLFMVKAGRVEIYTEATEDNNADTPEHVVFARIGRSRVFGELSVLNLGSRTTSARALGQGCVLLTLASQAFNEFLDLYPRDAVLLLRAITDVIAHHLQKANERLQRQDALIRKLQEGREPENEE